MPLWEQDLLEIGITINGEVILLDELFDEWIAIFGDKIDKLFEKHGLKWDRIITKCEDVCKLQAIGSDISLRLNGSHGVYHSPRELMSDTKSLDNPSSCDRTELIFLEMFHEEVDFVVTETGEEISAWAPFETEKHYGVCQEITDDWHDIFVDKDCHGLTADRQRGLSARISRGAGI